MDGKMHCGGDRRRLLLDSWKKPPPLFHIIYYKMDMWVKEYRERLTEDEGIDD